MSKESIRKHLISEGFKSFVPVEAYELTNEQKKELNGVKSIKIFDWNGIILKTKVFLDVASRK